MPEKTNENAGGRMNAEQRYVEIERQWKEARERRSRKLRLLVRILSWPFRIIKGAAWEVFLKNNSDQGELGL